MRIALALAALVVAVGLAILLVLSRDSAQTKTVPPVVGSLDAAAVQDAHTVTTPPPAPQDAPTVRAPDDSPQLQAVRSSGVASEPWVNDAAALGAKLARGASTSCYVAGCIIVLPPTADRDAAQRVLAADTSWTGGKQWIGATLILYRPD